MKPGGRPGERPVGKGHLGRGPRPISPSRIRTAIAEDRRDEVMYHVGRPGEDGYTERVLAGWGVDGHNSHTNICSSNARIGYQSWMGHDRPSSDYANAEVIFLISSHLESRALLQPARPANHRGPAARAQRSSVADPRLSNTGLEGRLTGFPPGPGPSRFCAWRIARLLHRERHLEQASSCERWTNWETYLAETRPDLPVEFESVSGTAMLDEYAEYTPAEAERVSRGVDEAIAVPRDRRDHRCPSHQARHPQLARCGCGQPGWLAGGSELPVLLERAHRVGGHQVGGTSRQRLEQVQATRSVVEAEHRRTGTRCRGPRSTRSAYHEMSILLPHFLNEGRGKARRLLQPCVQPHLDQPRRVQHGSRR